MEARFETGIAPNAGPNFTQPTWRQPVAVWLLIVAIFIGSHTAFHFQKPHFEVGDEAANALQIRNAKSFDEIYGNYSRWGFHHPGPAWWYAYALAEGLLYDFVRVVRAPSNAHLLMGIMLQAFFFTWAITIAQRHVRNLALTPLLLVFAGLHFSAVNFYIPDSAFQSIWPPHVLAFPFLCFLVASASVASGQARDLVPLVLTGALLVHSHVAQPLFVVPLSLLAYFGPRLIGPRRERYSLLWAMRASPRRFAISLVILAIFILPLAIDLTRGQQSNLRLILGHFTGSSGDHKTLAQSVLYLLAFLCYVPTPERFCDQLTASSLIFLKDRAGFLVMWAAVAIAAVFLLRRRARTAQDGDAAFVRWLAIFLAAALALTVVWGKMQTGAMFAFNSHFNFGLFFVAFILLGIGATGLRVFSTQYAQPSLYVLAVPLLFLVTKDLDPRSDFPSLANDNAALAQEARRAARRDKQAPRKKFLLFEHHLWPHATGIAIALERYGYRFRVSREWAVMFGNDNDGNLAKELAAGKVALWRLRSPGPDGLVISASIPEIDPAGAEISFSGAEANAAKFAPVGWDISTGAHSWSTAARGIVYFAAVPTATDVVIKVHLFPADFSGKKPQRVGIKFNDGAIQEFDVWRDGTLEMRVPAETWNQRAHASLLFEFPDAISPAAAGVSDDQRPISCGFTKITFGPSPAGR